MQAEIPILYIACPYAHSDPATQKHRFETACRAASLLMKSGIVVFSPLSHSVPIAEIGGIPEDHDFWMLQDKSILRHCSEMLILGLPGWQQSHGVIDEMFTALAMRIPITLIEEADIDNLPTIPQTAKHFLQSKIFS